MVDSRVSRGLAGAGLVALGVCTVSIWREPHTAPGGSARSAEPAPLAVSPPIAADRVLDRAEVERTAEPAPSADIEDAGPAATAGAGATPAPTASRAAERAREAERMAVLLREQATKIERELARARKRGEPEDVLQVRVLKRLKERAAEVDERASAFRAQVNQGALPDGG